MTGEATASETLIIERVFDAPRELVFEMWTAPKHAARWWGPKGADLTIEEMAPRSGGKWRKRMDTNDGKQFWRSGVYSEIVPPERLVFTYFSDDPNSDPGNETLVTVTFKEHSDNRTKLTLHQTGFESVSERDSHRGGWTTTLERLGELLAESR